MQTVQWIPTLQCNSAKVILSLNVLVAKHGVLKSLNYDGGPQFNCTPPGEFADTLQFDHVMMSQHDPYTYGFDELLVTIIKGLLICTIYSGQDSQLGLFHTVTCLLTPIYLHLLNSYIRTSSIPQGGSIFDLLIPM